MLFKFGCNSVTFTVYSDELIDVLTDRGSSFFRQHVENHIKFEGLEKVSGEDFWFDLILL